MWSKVHPVYDPGIRIHDTFEHAFSPITTRPGLPPLQNDFFNLLLFFSKIRAGYANCFEIYLPAAAAYVRPASMKRQLFRHLISQK